jgi:DNA-binding transcriptional LysR family regulator
VEYRPSVSCNDMAMATGLIAAGAGIGLLHHASHQAQIMAGTLRVLPTQPAFPPMEFVVVHKRSAVGPLVERVVEAAIECSDFKITPP